MKDYSERRRRYYINKKFQRDFILKFCGLALLGSFVSGLIIYIMASSTVTTTFDNLKLTIKSTADFILPAVFLASAFVFVLVGISSIVITLFTSHKIAGPLYRIEKDVDQIALGRLNTTIHLRHGDELKPMVVSLNLMAVSLREKVSEIKKEFEAIEKDARAKGAVIPDDIVKKLEAIGEKLNRFTT